MTFDVLAALLGFDACSVTGESQGSLRWGALVCPMSQAQEVLLLRWSRLKNFALLPGEALKRCTDTTRVSFKSQASPVA